MLTNKELDLLDYLSTQNESISVEQLSQEFNLSQRSIRNYMDSIIQELGFDVINLEKGRYIVKNQSTIREYLNRPKILSQSSELKKIMMLYSFVFEGFINLSQISRDLDLSRTTAKMYFDDLVQNLSPFAFRVEAREQKGLFLVCDEDTLRKIQLQTLIHHHNLSLNKQKIVYPWISKPFEVVDDALIEDFLKAVQKTLNTILSDYAYIIMSHYLRIMIYRMVQSQLIESDVSERFLIQTDEFIAIQKHIHKLQSATHLHFSEHEQIKLASHLVGSHYSQSHELKENTWFEHHLLITKLISLFSLYANVNLNQDVHLYTSLMNHLKPTMYRLLHRIKLTGLDYHDIARRYKKEFDITQKVLHELHFFTNTEIDHDEIALLTIHFKAAMMRLNEHTSHLIKVLIVCSHGYGTSMLLEQQITSTYDVEVLSCIPHHFLPHFHPIDEVDVIITTINSLTFPSPIPIIYVHPLLSSNDFKKLDQSFILRRKNQVSLKQLCELVEKHTQHGNLDDFKKDVLRRFPNQIFNDIGKFDTSLFRFLPIENIRIIDDVQSYKEAVTIAGTILVENGFVKSSYVEDIVTSFENYGSYMMLDEGIAIPHARNEANVFATGIALLILKQPIDFLDHQLNVFFAFCSYDHQEHIDALVTISKLVRESDFKEKLASFSTQLDVLNFILKHAHLETQ